MSASRKVEKIAQPQRFGFLLLRNYTMISLASAVDPLRMANQLSGEKLYQWYLITEDGTPVAASDGILTVPDASMAEAPALDTLLVVGGVNIVHSYSEKQLAWLRKLNSRDVQLGGVCTGAFVLAEANLMEGQQCSVHWECMTTLQELHPGVTCNHHLFTVSPTRVTCTGGTAPMDMMLNIICENHGATLANGISEMFIIDRIRDQNDYQKVPLKYTLGTAPPKLIEATTLMETNIEEPIFLEDLASLLSISRRQLERLFKNNLDCSPSRYYLKIRLHRARQLLKQSTIPIIEVAALCGFVSTPHFSKCYRTYMGIPPSQERSQAQHSIGTSNNPGEGKEGGDAESKPDEAEIEPSFGSVRLSNED